MSTGDPPTIRLEGLKVLSSLSSFLTNVKFTVLVVCPFSYLTWMSGWLGLAEKKSYSTAPYVSARDFGAVGQFLTWLTPKDLSASSSFGFFNV